VGQLPFSLRPQEPASEADGPDAQPGDCPEPGEGPPTQPSTQPQVLIRYWTLPVPLGASKLRPGLYNVVTQRASAHATAFRRALELFHADVAVNLAVSQGRLHAGYPVLPKLRAAGACFLPHSSAEVGKLVTAMQREGADVTAGVTLWLQAGGPAPLAPSPPLPSPCLSTCAKCGRAATVVHSVVCNGSHPVPGASPGPAAPPATRASPGPCGPNQALGLLPKDALVQGLYGTLSRELYKHAFRTLFANLRNKHLQTAVRAHVTSTFGLPSSMVDLALQGLAVTEPPPLLSSCLQTRDCGGSQAGWTLAQLCTAYRAACRPRGAQQTVGRTTAWDDATLTSAVIAAFELRHHLGVATTAEWCRRVRAGVEEGSQPPARPPVVPQASWGTRPLTITPDDVEPLRTLADALRYS
jgi:hypothetical protein